jgi:hypothetical protein
LEKKNNVAAKCDSPTIAKKTKAIILSSVFKVELNKIISIGTQIGKIKKI